MTKEERIKYMKRYFPEKEIIVSDAAIPASKIDIEDEMQLMDSIREEQRDIRFKENKI